MNNKKRKYDYLVKSDNSHNQVITHTKEQALKYKKIFEKTDKELQQVYHNISLPKYYIEKIEYLHNLDYDKMIDIIKMNDRLISELQEDLYQTNMDMQLEFANNLLGKNFNKYIDIEDDYNSWYSMLRDYRQFLLNIDRDYLTLEEQELYDKLIKKLNVLDNMEYGSDNYYNLDEWLENKSKELLGMIDKNLHAWEEIPTEEESIEFADENDCLDDLFIKIREDNTSDDVIYNESGTCYM